MLDDADREWVRAITSEIVRSVIDKTLPQHIESCPHGKRLLFIIGVCLGSCAAGGAAGGAIGALISKILLA